MHHAGAHGEEGEDEGDEGLALSDQVPVRRKGVEPGVVGGASQQRLKLHTCCYCFHGNGYNQCLLRK